MNYDAVSRSYIVLGRQGRRQRGERFYLDEDALDNGMVRAADGTGEQCDGCGEELRHADVTANASGTKVKCACGEVYAVEVKS